MENIPNFKNFIKKKYNDLAGSKETSRAFEVKRKEEKIKGSILKDDQEQRIESYFSRLHDIVKDDRGFELLKHKIYEKYLTKEKDIPDLYFENIMRDSGYLGSWYNANEIQKQEYRKQNSEVLLEDQKSSLEEWLDYFKNTDSNYIPDEIKYYIFRNILNMTEYNKEEKKFEKRSKGTVKKFPDLNHEALGYLVDSLIKKYKGEEKEFEYDISTEDREKFKQYLEKEDFVKLYSWCYENFKPIPEHLLPVTEGSWVKYKKGASHKDLVDSIKGKGTGWCTAGEQTAKSQLKGGDFYVYYSIDDEKNPTIPRIAIRMQDDSIAEVRGIAYKQNLDPYVVDILKDKLEEFPDKEKYLKKEKHNTLLTTIDKKVRKKEDLNKDELIFIYQINEKIQGFGYQDDPRIKEILNTRDIIKDANQIFDDKVATSLNEINSNTKAYIGPIHTEKDISKKLSHLEHIYTSLPGKKIEIIKPKIMEYPKNTNDWIKSFQERNIYMEDGTEKMLELMKKGEISQNQKFIELTVRDIFGDTQNHTYEEICNKIQELGLELCLQDDGPKLLLSYDQPVVNYFRTAMSPIVVGDPRVWNLYRIDGGSVILDWDYGESDRKWDSDREFLFRLSK